jgi:precorrin-6A/cobalt-precorrin-6A reductase
MKILILGGTYEARELANQLFDLGHDVTTSLAGRTSEPNLPRGEHRIGGFGGFDRLAVYLTLNEFDRLVDATHPYATEMSASAIAAAKVAEIPLIRLVRPPWVAPKKAPWINLVDADHAAAGLPKGAKALLTIGHQGLEPFFKRRDCSFVVRTIEPLEMRKPANAEVLLARPPFSLGDEIKLMRGKDITHLVSKNSGGSQTEHKLEAAEALGVVVIMIARPLLPATTEVATVEDAIEALELRDTMRQVN